MCVRVSGREELYGSCFVRYDMDGFPSSLFLRLFSSLLFSFFLLDSSAKLSQAKREGIFLSRIRYLRISINSFEGEIGALILGWMLFVVLEGFVRIMRVEYYEDLE